MFCPYLLNIKKMALELGNVTLNSPKAGENQKYKVLAFIEDGTPNGDERHLNNEDIEGTIGRIETLTTPQSPSKYLRCLGQELSRSDYPDLYAVAENNPLFGPGDGVNTFTIPNIPPKPIAAYTATAPTADENGDPTLVQEQIGTDENGDPIYGDFGNGTFENTYLYSHIKIK